MPGMILPSGQYAMVAHPTEYAKRPYILINGRWFRVSHGPQISARGITEHTVREAIQNEGYRPVFFGLKIEIPEPAATTATFTYSAPSTWSIGDLAMGDEIERNTDAWARLNETIRNTSVALDEGARVHAEAAESINTYANTSYMQQMEQYQRWINERGYGGVSVTPGSRSGGYTGRNDLPNENWYIEYNTDGTQTISNPHGDDTTRRYPTSEQITTRRRR